MSRRLAFVVALALAGCGAREEEPPPEPPRKGEASPREDPAIRPPPPPPPDGMRWVIVAANSTPPGAQVIGGERPLGTTPFETDVPVPIPAPGETQTFAFTFTLDGHEPFTTQASPRGGRIDLAASLVPVGAEPAGGEPRVVTVRGRGGGAIVDHRTTIGIATVSEPCVIERLEVRLAGTHTYYGDLYVSLAGPGGEQYGIASGGSASPFRSHVVRRARGRQARGRWTLSVADRASADSGQLTGWGMTLACR